MTLDEAKAFAKLCMDGTSPARVFKAGVVMLAPMIKGFGVNEIVEATGYERNFIERVVTNLVRWGIWEDDTWRAEWCEFFVTSAEEMPEDRPERLAMAFILDAMVGAGELYRTHEESEFKYGKI